jgi:molybdopterin molybdotransferase
MRTGITLAEARRLVLDDAAPLPAERMPAEGALGRVLAEPVASPRTLPPADVSAMDGYALRAEDVAGASGEGPVALPVAFEVRAGGGAPRRLGPGEAARIFTGAPVPDGADTVVRQEDTEAAEGRVAVRVAPPRGEHVRPAGEDVREGDVVLPPGTRLGPPQLGMLASLGRTRVAVHRRPRVAILSGGDELVEPDARDLSGGRIVSSNGIALAAQCREAGAEAVDLGIARDTPQDLERAVRAGLFADLLVSSAGVSVGDHDHVRPVLEKLGCHLVFWGVRIKPGYPVVFGRFEGAGPRVFGLPGNPVSAMVTFEQLVRPLLLRLAGHAHLHRPILEARLGETLTKAAGRMHLVRVVLEREAEGFVARPTGTQSSGVLRSMTLAHGLLVFPAEAERLDAGAAVRVQLLDPDVLAPPEAGF